MKLFRVRLFKYLKRGLLLLFIIPLVYLGFQVYFALQSGYITQVAIKHDLSESIPSIGIAVRDEMVVQLAHNGFLHYLPTEGERVTKDSVIAYVFNDIEMAQNNVQILRLQEELATLTASVDLPDNVTSDIANISKQQTEAYYELLDVVYSEDYSNLHQPSNELSANFNRLQLAMEQPCDVSGEIDRLNASIATLTANSVPSATITSPEVGYFVRDLDGGEDIYNIETATSWNSTTLATAIENAKSLTATEQVTGKLVLDYQWDFYCLLPELESGALREGASYEIAFSEANSQVIPVELERVDPPDEDGMVLLQFTCKTLTPEVAKMRYTAAEIIITNFEGIRVPREALRIVDGEKGVYVQFGNLIQFKKIVPIFENEEYMLLPLESDAENEVQLYDVIVVEGRDLYDGKFL